MLSGGHTSEMLRLLSSLDLRRFQACLIAASSDDLSLNAAFESLKTHPSIQVSVCTVLRFLISLDK